MLIPNPKGRYHFLKGIAPYSAGVIADPGFEIVHVTLRDLDVEWRHGFDLIEARLRAAGVEGSALCGVELRSPAPFTMQGFISFNDRYCQVLKQWGLYVGDVNPVARTNVVPLYSPPESPILYGFSYVVPTDEPVPPTLVIAGAGELRDGILDERAIVRAGDTGPEAIAEKAALVMKVMEERLHGLGARWDLLHAINVYTVHPIDDVAERVILNRLGPARNRGIHWHRSRPPVADIEFEMDMRGVRQELFSLSGFGQLQLRVHSPEARSAPT
jgi:hypothetical protein